MFEKKVLLDTCALIWLAAGDKTLSLHARESIENATVVFVSAISAWEISLKQQHGTLKLSMAAEKWFNKAIMQHKLTIAPLDIDILVAANSLPWHHRDPADRFIIATALRENACIITHDKRFELYDVQIIQ
jgi:PIN domain nuclease of toxin-antitoxin system